MLFTRFAQNFLLSAAIGGMSYIIQLYGAKSLPATVLYPFITGGRIVFSALTGAAIFKEKLSGRVILKCTPCQGHSVFYFQKIRTLSFIRIQGFLQ